MANSQHFKLLHSGVDAWNAWRAANPEIDPNLSHARLEEMDLSGANLSHADLTEAYLWETDLTKANLELANLAEAQLMGANLTSANLQGANLENTNLKFTDFSKADLSGAGLEYANLVATVLTGAKFDQTLIGATVFANVDLSQVKYLESVIHVGPSSIGIDTLYKSQGKVSEIFLRNAGVAEEMIAYLPSLIGAVQPFQWHSCFISYSTKNQKFAERLHSRMREAGLRVWFAPEDMKGGRYSDEQIDQAIQLHDRLLLVLSEDSIRSKWVEREIRKTRKIERAEKRRKLFPITLTDYTTLKKWECLDSDTGEDLAEEVRKYHIPDFSNWKNHDAFERAFARLEKDLRTSIR